MTTLGHREKCLVNRSEKGAFPAVACPPDAKPALLAPRETPWTKPAQTLQRKAVRSIRRARIGESKRKFRFISPALRMQLGG